MSALPSTRDSRKPDIGVEKAVTVATVELEFNDLAHIAANICKAPMAAVTLFDEHGLCVKARVGFKPVDCNPKLLFCSHGVASSSDFFEVTDASADSRFAESPLVLGEPHIRHYAGVRLKNREGRSLGMFCVMDREPRRLSALQREMFRLLAGQVTVQLELRREIAAWDDVGRQRIECEIRKSLDEKEMLLKEIHHRVKNNMQIITSLLNLQADAAEDERIRASFANSRQRIGSMALIHEKLYQSADLARVDFGGYIRDLMDEIRVALGDCARGVAAEVQAKHVQLGVDTAIPCGLIINELVTNAFKHAFPDGGGGAISVRMRREGRRVRLTVSDTGCGIGPGLDFGESTSLGMKLVLTLVRQLDGEFAWKNDGGAVFTLSFDELPDSGLKPSSHPTSIPK